MSADLQVDVAVIGAGPSGLACAMALRARGVSRVLVLEREVGSGGAVRHCGHPAFGVREFGRLLSGPAYVRRLHRQAIRAGVELRLRCSVVALHAGGRLEVATPDGPLQVSAGRVVLAMGARETPRSARLTPGERPLGVMNTGALQASIYLEGLKPFTRPVIVGTELVGLSALWTCLGHGVRPAAVVEAGEGPTAGWPLSLFPRLLGVPVYYGAEIVDIAGRPRVRTVNIRDASGARHRIEGDGVVFTGRFRPESALLGDVVEMDPGTGGPRIDQYGRCSDPSYFAVGNLLRAIETAGWCHREGARTGRRVADDLAGRLPVAARQTPLQRGRGVKLTAPQVLSLPLADGHVGAIQVRASEALRGHLVLRADEQAIWSRRMRLRPERRILAPMPRAEQLEGCASLSLGLE